MSGKRDYYDILAVAKTASDDEIKKAYRVLAMKHHPDRNAGDEEAAHHFKQAAEAYAVLSDPQKKPLYDRYGHAGLAGGGPQFHGFQDIVDNLGDVFSTMFGGGSRRRGPQQGEDLQVVLTMKLHEAVRSCTKTITFNRLEMCGDCRGSGAKKGSAPATCKQCKGQGVTIANQGFFRVQQTCRGCGGAGRIITDPCPTCRGRCRVEAQRSVDVEIPAGVFTRVGLTKQGEGNVGEPGGPRGDLVVVIQMEDHPIFERDEENHVDLSCSVPITFSQAALGAEIEIPTLDGPKPHTLKPGVQSGDEVRVKGKGMPHLRSGKRGDLVVELVVETPRTLTKRHEELFRELADIEHKHVSPQRKGFFDKLKDLFVGSEEHADDRKNTV